MTSGAVEGGVQEIAEPSRRNEKRSGGRAEVSRLLTTMAIVRANADANRDYISNFEPFATDYLQSLPPDQAVRPEALSAGICEKWGVPSLPSAVGKILISRAEDRGELVRVDKGLYPNSERLADIPGIGGEKTTMLAGMNALADKVVQYATEIHGLYWSREDATTALGRLTEEFGAELALAKRQGSLEGSDLQDDEALVVVHGFARRALEADPEAFKHLEEMVQGTMLVNALYFPDVGHVSNRLKTLRIYLDTTPVLRLLELADDPVFQATQQMVSLLRDEFRIPMFIFSHTLDEIDGVLDGIAAALRRGTTGAALQAGVGGRNREAIDALVRRGATAGEIEGLRSELKARLGVLKISITDTPPHVEKGHIDEERFDEVLDEVVAYRSRGPRDKDLKSLAAIDRLRGSSRPRDLAQANALFVTANPKLVRASREYFHEADRSAPVPHAMHETALTAQLWVRAPHPLPDLPRQLLIADCYAALNPGPELWERWVQHIIRLKERGKVSDEQVQNLIYHQQAKSKLFEVTHGDPDAVGDETVADVLDRFETDLQKPLRLEVETERQARKEVEQERDSLEDEVADLQTWRREEEKKEKRHQIQLAKVRLIAGYLGVGIVALTLVGAAALGMIYGRLVWSGVITLTIFLCASSWAWGTKRGWRVPFVALISAGGITALFVKVWSVLPPD
jgi:hypothetical protein